MPQITAANVQGVGIESATNTVKRTYWRAPANSVTTAATITRGAVVVADLAARGAATFSGSTRSSVGGTPAYTADASAQDVMANVIIADSGASTYRAPVHILADQTLTAGNVGNFYVGGRVRAQVSGRTDFQTSGAIAAGDRLTIAQESTYLGTFRKAVNGETVWAIALQAVSSAAVGTLIDVQLVEPYQLVTDTGGPEITTALTATDATRIVFVATRACQFVGVSVAFTTASTSGTLQIEKCTGTTAPGSGTSLLTGTVSLSGTANTVVSGTRVGTVASYTLAAGDRLGIVIAGTMTNLAGGICSISLQPI